MNLIGNLVDYNSLLGKSEMLVRLEPHGPHC